MTGIYSKKFKSEKNIEKKNFFMFTAAFIFETFGFSLQKIFRIALLMPHLFLKKKIHFYVFEAAFKFEILDRNAMHRSTR